MSCWLGPGGCAASAVFGTASGCITSCRSKKAVPMTSTTPSLSVRATTTLSTGARPRRTTRAYSPEELKMFREETIRLVAEGRLSPSEAEQAADLKPVTFLSKLPATTGELFGREKELALLDEAWRDQHTPHPHALRVGRCGQDRARTRPRRPGGPRSCPGCRSSRHRRARLRDSCRTRRGRATRSLSGVFLRIRFSAPH